MTRQPTSSTHFPYTTLFRSERESGTARLEEAVAIYRAALEERTRERVPLDWAITQSNLGKALQILGERERDRKSTRLNSSHMSISYAVFCLKKKKSNIKVI